ncbi:MAG: DUF3849 domain-containing protein, partial [Bacteroidales bacterium]|nr:DUF3849 domain-containing protein [Bacteroidales bacterium]
MAVENKEYTPIYYESPEKAYRESVTSPEADAFRASFSATEKCVSDIQAALVQSRAGTGMFSSTNFIEGILDRHGKDRVEYCLASYVRSHENESPYFSDEVKKWARGIRISDSYMIANTIIIAGGD